MINSSTDSEKVAKDLFAYEYKLHCSLFIHADDSVGGSQGINLKPCPLTCLLCDPGQVCLFPYYKTGEIIFVLTKSNCEY